jgi:hypothetical protein
MKTTLYPSKSGKSILLSIVEGYSTYKVTVPLQNAIRLFSDGVESVLRMLLENENWAILDKEGIKSEIQERLRNSVELYQRILSLSGR